MMPRLKSHGAGRSHERRRESSEPAPIELLMLGFSALDDAWRPGDHLIDEGSAAAEALVWRGLAEHRFMAHAWTEHEPTRWETHLQRSGRAAVQDALDMLYRCRGWLREAPWGGALLEHRVHYALHNEEYRLTRLGLTLKFACVNGDEEVLRFIETMPAGDPRVDMSCLRPITPSRLPDACSS